MKRIREITSKEEDFRTVPWIGSRFETIKRNPVKPVPVGTIILVAFRVTGYDPDCDGGLMARLEQVDKDGEPTGWEQNAMGLYKDTELITSLEELNRLFKESPIDDTPREKP